ncbi:MAG: SGNH/GDSL hydrolase family protein [Opitutales bacterium]|nr:SGNH/GDSL hydrolase family protein [Opitutales bacterium]
MLVIGDSISMNYTPMVRDLVSPQIEVHHIGTNGAHTRNGLGNLENWLGNESWDIIHFNWGLHDLRRRGGEYAVPIEDYEKNLRLLVERLKETQAHLIWASTTPVPPGSRDRTNDDALAYNEAAQRVMLENGIQINDLYTFVRPHQDEWMRNGNVHFHQEGYQALAEKIVSVLDPHSESSAGVIFQSATNPEIRLVYPDDDDTLGQDISVLVETRHVSLRSDGVRFRLYLNDQEQGLFHKTKPIPLTGLPSGGHQLRVVLVDADGKETGVSDQRHFTVVQERAP